MSGDLDIQKTVRTQGICHLSCPPSCNLFLFEDRNEQCAESFRWEVEYLLGCVKDNLYARSERDSDIAESQADDRSKLRWKRYWASVTIFVARRSFFLTPERPRGKISIHVDMENFALI